jgi:hypothetical protein
MLVSGEPDFMPKSLHWTFFAGFVMLLARLIPLQRKGYLDFGGMTDVPLAL